MNGFIREKRYLVWKCTDLVGAGITVDEIDQLIAICAKVDRHREALGKSDLECVVVEKDWPEYEPTWMAIERRVAAMVVGAYDAAEWRARCERLAAEANRGCGLVYETFVRAFTLAVNQALNSVPQAHRPEAIEIAKQFGWASDEELAATQRLMDEAGCCSHGLDPRWCPVGCGDLEHFEGC